MKIKHIAFIVIGFFICLLPLAWGIFHAGLFVSDDGHWMVIRLSAFYEALSSGQFPVRILPRLNNGYGYPVADFLYPLFLYIGSFLHILKVPFLLDIKIILFGSFLISGIGMFVYLRKFFGDLASFLGGLMYVYLPYHLYDLYTRGSVGEILSLSLVPFALWAVEKRSWALVSLFLGLLILAHNTLALFFLPVIILYAVLRKLPLLYIVGFSLVGLGLSAFFWLPALLDRQYTVFESIAVSNPFTYFVNSVSYYLVGWIALVTFVAVFFVKSSIKNREVRFFYVLGIVSLFFSFSVSTIFWHSRYLAQFVQFPFRFLSVTLLAESFLGAFLIEKCKQNKILVGIFILLVVFSALPYLFSKQYDMNPESFYDTNTATTTVQNEYMPKWIHGLPEGYAFNRVGFSDKKAFLSNLELKGTRVSFTVLAPHATTVSISFVYFPGWQATVDRKSVSISPSKNGLVEFAVPAGRHNIIFWYSETMLHLFADGISVVSLLFIVGFFLKIKPVRQAQGKYEK